MRSSNALTMNPRLWLPLFSLIANTVLVALINPETEQHSRHLQQQDYQQQFYREHDPLFPLTSRDYWGFFLAIIGLMIAAGGGIGGGGILVPIFCLVIQFSPKRGIPLSNVTVFGGAVANAIFNVTKRHPLADRPLVDWDLMLVMEPLTIAGALIGASLNKILPELLLTLLLVLLLTLTAYSSLRSAVKLYKKETIEMRLRADGTKESEVTKLLQGAQVKTEAEGLVKLVKHSETVDGDEEDLKQGQMLPDQKSKELQQILDSERVTPIMNVRIITALFVVVLVINLLKGGGAFPSPLGISCGSQGFWMANAAMLLWIVVVMAFARVYLIRKYEAKVRCGFEFVEGDIQWTPRATLVYPVICCASGFFAGMFGVGGGIVKGPLMLALGVHPAVSSATSSIMILFTSFTATTSYLVFGLLVPGYTWVCFVIGFAATVVGQVGLSYLMKENTRNSYISFSIGFVVLLSAFLMTIQSLFGMADGEKHHSGGICWNES